MVERWPSDGCVFVFLVGIYTRSHGNGLVDLQGSRVRLQTGGTIVEYFATGPVWVFKCKSDTLYFGIGFNFLTTNNDCLPLEFDLPPEVVHHVMLLHLRKLRG